MSLVTMRKGHIKMVYDIRNEIFNNREDFLDYFEQNDSDESRKAILKTSRLCYWYCYLIEDKPEVASAITEEPYKSLYDKYVKLVSDVKLANNSLILAVKEG